MFFTMDPWLGWRPQWQIQNSLWGGGLKIATLVIKWPFQAFKLMWWGSMAGWLECWTWIWMLLVLFPFWPLAGFACSSPEFNAVVTLLNSQLVWLLPVEILSHEHYVQHLFHCVFTLPLISPTRKWSVAFILQFTLCYIKMFWPY